MCPKVIKNKNSVEDAWKRFNDLLAGYAAHLQQQRCHEIKIQGTADSREEGNYITKNRVYKKEDSQRRTSRV